MRPMTELMTPQPSPPPAHPPAGRSWPLILLIVVSLLLGLAVAWALSERDARHRLGSHVQTAALQTTILESRTGDLMRLLGRSDTQIQRLRAGDTAPGHAATIVWNHSHGWGYVFCDLPASLVLIGHVDGQQTVLLRFTGGDRVWRFELPPKATPEMRFTIEDASSPAAGGGATLFSVAQPSDHGIRGLQQDSRG